MPTVGLIGIGLVGAALAERMLDAGHAVVGHDVDPTRCALLRSMGGTPVDTSSAVIDAARCVILALVQPVVTQHVVESITPSLRGGDIVIDVGTGDPQRIRSMLEMIVGRGADLVDAPLSGSSEQIRAGAAIAMIGGCDNTVERLQWLWPAIAEHLVHLGPTGSGQRAKLATNLVLGLNRAALAEGLAFAEALGLDAAAFVELLRISPAYSRAVDVKGERMLNRRYEPESRIVQHRKDVTLMLAAAESIGMELPLSLAHAAQLDAAIAQGLGERDNAAIVEVWRQAGRGLSSADQHATKGQAPDET